MAVLITTDPRALPFAREVVVDVLAVFDAACSRFWADSEITRLHRSRGTAVDRAFWAVRLA